MTAPQSVLKLVDRFHRNYDEYVNKGYRETPVRRDFVDPLFESLGWDVANKKGLPETTREVLHEDSIKIGGVLKAPDYCFRVGRIRRFFVEAKRPFENIDENNKWAFQLRRYGWSAKVPLSILTDFKGIAVYDCRFRPHKDDDPRTAQVDYFNYEDLPKRWDDLAATFSREAVLSGSFDSYAELQKDKRGSQEVNESFLEEIEQWRDTLARHIALRNSIGIRELNYAVQQTINRIVFLRICEDRGIEEYGRLLATTESEGVYERLCELFRDADARYNSGLFHFTKEKNRSEEPDELTPSLLIDDKPLHDIITSLYYPDCPFEFSVLSTDLLGQVYEQFLGKTIRLTAKGRAVVEEKPELRKAGGVYYTPSYVSEYIVERVLGELTRKASPKSVSKLRILDPACGSGSFLIQAFDFLLAWHLKYYLKQPSKYTNEIYQVSTDLWRLTTGEKRRILLNNIYGVDLDTQAVEVTKLSLVLKLMEGETEQTIDNQLKLLHEQALPDLGRNIKTGNSLIGRDFYTQGELSFSTTEEGYRVNPFDWGKQFERIIGNGGFDAVIGNPPYRRELDYKYLMDEIAGTEFGAKYRSARMDLWYYFVHRSLELLKDDAPLSFIVNSYWTSGTGAEKLITALREEAHLDEVFSLGKLKVFNNVSGQHMIIRVSNGKSTKPILIRTSPMDAKGSAEPYVRGQLPLVEFKKPADKVFRAGKIDLEQSGGNLLDKLEQRPRLSEYGIVRQGIAENPSTVNKKTNLKFKGEWQTGEGVFALTPDELKRLKVPAKERTLLRRYHDLCDLERYWLAEEPSRVLIYSTKNTCPDIRQFPVLHKHLARFRPIMEKRRETKDKSNSWWHLHWPRDEAIWQAPKVIAKQMASRPAFVPADIPVYVPFSVNVFVPSDDRPEHLFYFAAVLNSRLMWKWFQHYAKRRGVALEINGNVLEQAPIRELDFDVSADRDLHDEIVAGVTSLMEGKARLATARTAHEREVEARRCEALDQRLDDLIYNLYELSTAEVKIVQLATVTRDLTPS
jgi:type I restriction-modification system DNA methylase subunit